MRETSCVPSLLKRLVLAAVSLLGLVVVCVFSSRLAVDQIFRGIAAQRSTGLSAWSAFPSDSLTGSGNRSVSRSADLQSRTGSFDASTAGLHRIVSAHHGEFDDLRTESHSGQGRTLTATFSVPTGEFDRTLDEVKALGRVHHFSEVSENSSVKAARLSRQVNAARINLARLQSLQHEHRVGIQDALALQKEIAKATEDLAQIENEQQGLLSTVSRTAVGFVLAEEYKAALNIDFPGALFQLRNSLFDGLSTTLSSLAICLGALFEYGLPIAFWAGALYYPFRLIWKKVKESRQSVSAPTL